MLGKGVTCTEMCGSWWYMERNPQAELLSYLIAKSLRDEIRKKEVQKSKFVEAKLYYQAARHEHAIESLNLALSLAYDVCASNQQLAYLQEDFR